ncbi:helix-turn-helix transcriptional regulator [Pseudogemmobacter humi]|uniref:Bifunctional biotin--[acetyl-CoA-carboxylase] synthetase/biotin operon repressor n=1 Tax=Pseudogemmobacter humi TaxID=2483812 RepID=A0A3P5WLR3_9RHOB|nr:HTH domain-containing protein [Pseudogemmobacter humi]VDC24483.1 bifunctional biotin--[acetyl-CoA-carboxylase] synthetase/biotin operon repressor [Pseudogemmobacter humi]
MKRDDRLYDIVQILRDGRLHTAQELADRLGVSTRTVWRDMAMMAATGLPVTGGRGLGYILRSPLMLPPTVLTPDEIDALATGLRHVEANDPARARAAKSLLYKIATLLPQAGIEAQDPREPQA